MSSLCNKAELPVTMMRLNKVKGLGPTLQIVEGYTVDLPRDITDPIEKRTDRAWPSTFFAPRVSGDGNVKDVYSIMANWGANHCALVSGHIGTEALALASALKFQFHCITSKKKGYLDRTYGRITEKVIMSPAIF